MERAHKGYAVITGASSGIGKEFAKRFARDGYDLILVARRENRLKNIQEEIERDISKEIKCECLEADLSILVECEKLADFIQEKQVVIFINNAGFGDCNFFLAADVKKELNMLDVNVRAVHYLTKRILLQFERQQKGYLLNVASSAGLIPAGPYMATYYASKAYVASLTRAVAEELREKKSPIYVGCLCPGPVCTEFDRVANVEFSLKGIDAAYCANYAVDQMYKKKVVIVPTLLMKLAVIFGRFIPQAIYIWLTAHQQKRKLKKSF